MIRSEKVGEVVSVGLLLLTAAMLILVGLLYLSTTRIMSYHEIYLGMRHEQLPPKVAALLLHAMKTVGALLVGQGVTVGMLAIGPFRRREQWSWLLLVVLCSVTLIPVLIVNIYVGPSSPWWLTGSLLGFVYVAAALHTPRRAFKNLTKS